MSVSCKTNYNCLLLFLFFKSVNEVRPVWLMDFIALKDDCHNPSFLLRNRKLKIAKYVLDVENCYFLFWFQLTHPWTYANSRIKIVVKEKKKATDFILFDIRATVRPKKKFGIYKYIDSKT